MKIIGCGTGRSGTHSLKEIIDGCEGWTCTQEMRPLMPWDPIEKITKHRIEHFKGEDKIGGVAFFYLPYIERFLDEFKDVKVISLKRDKDKTVASYKRNTIGKNHWIKHQGKEWKRDKYDKCYPNFDVDDSLGKEQRKDQAIRKYWEEYYEYSEWLQDVYPNRVKIYTMDVLNDRSTQEDMFNFVGIENPTFNVGIRTNVTSDYKE